MTSSWSFILQIINLNQNFSLLLTVTTYSRQRLLSIQQGHLATCHSITHECTPFSFQDISVTDVMRCRSDSLPLCRNYFLIRFYVPTWIMLSTTATICRWKISTGFMSAKPANVCRCCLPSERLYCDTASYYSGEYKHCVCCNATPWRFVAELHRNVNIRCKRQW